MVRVEDERGYHRGDTTARRLEQVESKARAVVSGELGCDCDTGVEFDLEVQLHPEVEFRFRVAEDLCGDASREVDAIVEGLTLLNVSAQDIVTLLGGRPLRAEPRRPLVVPNAEIAACGLDCRPEVVAVRWEDRGFGVTTYCRDCVQEDRSAWRDLPHGMSAVLYEGPLRCDVCDRDVAGADEIHQVRQMAADAWARRG
jgi:hypothetical protein